MPSINKEQIKKDEMFNHPFDKYTYFCYQWPQ